MGLLGSVLFEAHGIRPSSPGKSVSSVPPSKHPDVKPSSTADLPLPGLGSDPEAQMKPIATPIRTSFLITLSATVVLFTTGFSTPGGGVLPNQRPAGPIECDGTPFEEPELNPHVPDVPKDPGMPLGGSEAAASSLSSETFGETANVGWMVRVLAFYLSRVRL